MKILCSNPLHQFLSNKFYILNSIKKVLNKGLYIRSNECKKFEKEFSKYIGVPYCLGVANGTDAIEIALKSLGINKGDEVITTCHTASATVSAILNVGAKPVLIEADENNYNINYNFIEKAISKKTKVIIIVHIYGMPCDMNKIKKILKGKKIFLIEDCSQSHGAKYLRKKTGSFGDLSCFSFYPTKNLGAIGDGGAVLFRKKKYFIKAKLISEYGWKKKFNSYSLGRNSRLDEIQAALLRVKLKWLDKSNKKRIKIAKNYIQNLKNIKQITLPYQKLTIGFNSVFHLFVVKVTKRKALIKFLNKHGIFPLIHYPIPIHRQNAYKNKIKFFGNKNSFENLNQKILSLPIYPELKLIEQKYVIRKIKEFYEKF